MISTSCGRAKQQEEDKVMTILKHLNPLPTDKILLRKTLKCKVKV